MIEISNFSKKYSDVVVYNNFNLAIEEGKVTCILGESGCGKTTLLNAIAKLIKFDGNISDVKCSYVFQTPRLVPNLTVYENLKLICTDDTAIKNMLEKVNLSEKANSYPNSLSGGQSQRVSLARAFLYDSEILLLDEPFSSLDLKLKMQIMNEFMQLWQEDGRTVLFVTHDIDEAAYLSDRIILLSKGEVVFDFDNNAPVPRSTEEINSVRSKLISIIL